MNHRREAMQQGARHQIEANFDVLKELFRSSALLRAQLKERKKKIDLSALGGFKLSPLEAELILEGAHWLIELDMLLFSLWVNYRNYLPYSSEPDSYAPSRGASILDGATRTKGGLIALAAEIIRMDNARVVIELLGNELVLTQWLNRGDESRGIPAESFDRMLGSFRDPDRRALLQFHLRAIESSKATIEDLMRQDGEISFLMAILHESKAAKDIADESMIARQWHFAKAIFFRSMVLAFTPVLEGYIAFSIQREAYAEIRDLKQLQNSPDVSGKIFDLLRPLDILVLQDARYGLAGQGYNQVAVYLGDDHWILQQGVESHPGFLAHASPLRQGNLFLMLLNRGISFVDFGEILAAQDLAVIRLVESVSIGDNLRAIGEEKLEFRNPNIQKPALPITLMEAGRRIPSPSSSLESEPDGRTDARDGKAEVHDLGTVVQPEALAPRAKADKNVSSDLPLAPKNPDSGCMNKLAIKNAIREVFNLFVNPKFVNPPARSSSEYAATLLYTLYGQKCIEVDPPPGQNIPSLISILENFAENSLVNKLKMITNNTTIPPEPESTFVFHDHIKKRRKQEK